MKYIKYILIIMVALHCIAILNGKIKYRDNSKEDTTTSEIQEIKPDKDIVDEKNVNKVIVDESKEITSTTTNPNTDNASKENVKPNEEKNTSDEIKNNVQETPKQATAWEELGLTEYEYYNLPMWSWARIDFKVSDYGSQNKTEEACRSYGHKLAEEQDLGFSCTNINSYAGNYLGEMFETF